MYALLTFVLVLHHEVWSDEAQAWVLTRDCGFFELIKNVRVEGHPLLWYFLIMPFAKFVHCFNAVMCMQFLNWAFVVLGMAFFVFKSPFNNFVKTSVLFSSGFLYWYPVIARNYCLIPLLIFLLAILYPKQKEHPYWYILVLILLANTHVIMFGFCLALALIFAYNSFKDKTKGQYIACSLLFISLLWLVFYLWGCWDDNLTVSVVHNSASIVGVKKAFCELVKNFFGFTNLFLSFLLGAFLLFISAIFYINDKKIFFVFLINLLFQFSIYTFFWGILPQRAFTLILVVLFGLWIVRDSWWKSSFAKLFNIVFVVVLLCSFPNALKMSFYDYFNEYSGSKTSAKYIVDNIADDAFILTNDPFMSVSVSAYIPNHKNRWKFYSDKYNDYFTYSSYSSSEAMKDFGLADVNEYLLKNKEIYVLLSRIYFVNIPAVWESQNNVYSQEHFKIYRLNK